MKTTIIYTNLALTIAAILFWFFDSARTERIKEAHVILENKLNKDVQKKEFEYQSRREKEVDHRILRLEFLDKHRQ
jgi:hypothetical protein